MADSSPLAHSPTLQAGAPRTPSSDEQLPAGTKVGEYVVERFIGAGAMGEVYAGTHPVIGKRVAIKVLRHALAASAEAAERFVREARAVNQVEHDNVVDVFAFGRLDDGRLYLVMDLVEGRSLRAHLVNGPLELEPALAILDSIADALDAAHRRGVVHRDLKPDNIVLSNATPPKVFVLDFGIAKLITTATQGATMPTGPGTLTGAGTWLGTPGYMAPEQWSVDGAGPASDRYALGVIAFELLAGALPFTASSVPQMMEQHFRAQVPALSARGAVGLPSAIDDVLRKALAKDPEARFATGRALVDALRAASGDTAGRARGAVAMPGPSRKLWLPAMAGAGVLGVGLVVVLLGRGRDREERPRPSASTSASVRAPEGSVVVDVVSMPSGAEVKASNGFTGTAPAQLLARPGTTIDLVVRKPGYLPDHRSVTVGPGDSVVQVRLGEDSRFQGVWRLANGELRELKRRGDEVDVFKLSEVQGERTFFKQYTFGLADHGIAFGGEDIVIDPRGPNDPRCHVRVRVDYHYDPMHDVLELRREKVKIERHDGSCVVQAREIEPSRLVRVGVTADTHELAAPVGKPIVDTPTKATKATKASEATTEKAPPPKPTVRKPPSKKTGLTESPKVLPLDPEANLEASRVAKTKKAPPRPSKSAPSKAQDLVEQTPPTYTSPANAAGADQSSAPSQIAPQPQAPAPTASQQQILTPQQKK